MAPSDRSISPPDTRSGLLSLDRRLVTTYRFVWALALVAAVALSVAGQLQSFAPTRLLHQCVLVAVAIILFRRRSLDLVAAMISLSFLLWAITGSAALPGWIGGAGAAVLDRLRFLLFVSAMILFPGGGRGPRWMSYALAATGLVASIGCLAALGLFPTRTYQLLAMGCAALAVAALRQRFRGLEAGVERQQIKWVALGLASGLCLVAASRLGTPLLTHPAAGWLFDAGVILMALGVLVSLLRYRLYDADAAISRSTAYAALTLTLLATFGVSEAALQALSQAWFGGSAGIVSGGVAAGIAAALTAPAHQRLTDWADRRFQKALVALRRDLPERLEDLREFASVEAIATEIVDDVERALGPVRIALIVGEGVVAARHATAAAVEAWPKLRPARSVDVAAYDPADPHFPLQVALRVRGKGDVGWLLVGPRPDGSVSGTEEREALRELAVTAARALLIAREREKRALADAGFAQTIASLSARVEALETSARGARLF